MVYLDSCKVYGFTTKLSLTLAFLYSCYMIETIGIVKKKKKRESTVYTLSKIPHLKALVRFIKWISKFMEYLEYQFVKIGYASNYQVEKTFALSYNMHAIMFCTADLNLHFIVQKMIIFTTSKNKFMKIR